MTRRTKKPTPDEIELEVDRLEAALSEGMRQLYRGRPIVDRELVRRRIARSLWYRVRG